MSSKDSLSAPEVAELLDITKNTVYELVKRGEIPSYKIGKKLRIDREDVEKYISNQKGTKDNKNNYANIEVTVNKEKVLSKEDVVKGNDILISGQDGLIDILSDKVKDKFTGIRVLKSNTGSYTGLFDLYNDKVSMCTAHLWDGDNDEYNTPYVRRLLPGVPCILLNLAYRVQGFYVAKGNPLNIKDWIDLKRPDVKLINRERGSGTRILLDEKLRKLNISSTYINGYYDERNTHLSVASSIARNDGDVGLGSEKFALQVSGIDFIPMQEERYDLVIKCSDLDNPAYDAVIETIRSKEFKDILEGIGGYNLKDIGKILAKT